MGEVRFVASPDHESPTDANGDNVYDIVVHANDGVHDVTQSVSITLTFPTRRSSDLTSATTASEDENTAATNVVYTIAATDPDTVGTRSYSISGTDASQFSVDASTGEVRFVASTGRENARTPDTQKVHMLSSHANDSVHDVTQSVSITVHDLTNATPSPYTTLFRSEDENTAATNVVYTIAATDPDTVGTRSYSISGTDASQFSVDASTGEVRFVA